MKPIIFRSFRPFAAFGCLVLLGRWLRYFHRPLSLVAFAYSQSDVEVWSYRLCQAISPW